MRENKRETGNEREILACEYLEEEGVKILHRNFRCRQGEIDIIGKDGEYLVFFEVKYRKNANLGTPAEAVGIYKQQKICRTAAFYRSIYKVSENTPIRYDVIAILGERIEWIRNAFEHRY